MARTPESKPNDAEQLKRFIETAKEIGAAEDEAGADDAFKKVATPKERPAKSR